MSAAAASVNGNASAASSRASSTPGASQNSKHQLKTNASGKALDGPRKQASSPVDASAGKKPAPKAWQGTNPITQRSTGAGTPNGVPNGPAKGAPAPSRSPQPTPPVAATGPADDTYEPRMIVLLSKFIGLNGHITLQSGEKFDGIFSSLDSTSTRIVMKMVKRVSLATNQQVNASDKLNEYIGSGEDHILAFHLHNIVHLNVPGVQLSPADNKSSNGVGSSFRTDAEISGATGVRERELQPWLPGPDSQVDLSLDESALGTWDQFDTNARLYNVQSDYDENLYTTTIDRSDPRYAQREADARRIAKEMERSEPSNSHVAEERRMNANANAQGGLDEEDRYSGVRRDAPSLSQRNSNAYVPPSRRPITGQPTVSGAPYDPAIISSQIARPAPPVTVNSDSHTSLSQQPADQASRAIAAAQPAPTASPQPGTPPTATISVTEAPATTAAAKLPAASAPKGPVEGVERKVLDSFKSFANSEKLKLQNHQRAMQERNRVSARQEKSVKLNDLKKFAENFKLYSRVPDDLVPILAKTKEKQNEIVTKADQQAREKEYKVKTASPTPTSTPSKPEVEAESKAVRPTPTTGRSDTANDPASPFNNRQRLSQNFRAPNQPIPSPRGPGLMSHRMQQTQSQHRPGAVTANVPAPTPIADLRIPPSAPSQMREAGLVSPDSAASSRFNVKAMEFRPNPAASTFTPGPGKPSPEVTKRPSVSVAASSPAQFFSKDVKPPEERTPYDAAFNVIKRMGEKVKTGDEKTQGLYANNGGIPQAYRTQPRWEVAAGNAEKSYAESFPPLASTVSPMHTPSIGAMPHQNQLPPHLQQNVAPQIASAQNTPRFFQAQPQHIPNQHLDDHTRMQYASSNSSVQPSPRMGHPAMAYAGPMHPQMPNYPTMPPYMNPAMQMRPMPNGPQFGPQGPQMGGQMMVQQPSNGPFMGGPMGQPMQMYASPGPNFAQPHFPNHGQQPGGYAPSPRAHPMSQQGSQQGHQPGQPFMVPPGPQMMMQPHPGQMAQMRNFPQAQYQGGPHPGYNMQHRQMSGGGYNNHQMTPRQNHAAPHQGPNPGNGPPMHGAGLGDEGK